MTPIIPGLIGACAYWLWSWAEYATRARAPIAFVALVRLLAALLTAVGAFVALSRGRGSP